MKATMGLCVFMLISAFFIGCTEKESSEISENIAVINMEDSEIKSFSYESDIERYADDEAGIVHDGFKNTSEVQINNAEDAVNRAKNECTIEYDETIISYDDTTDVWSITFGKTNVAGGCQTIYMDGNGVTLLIVYGE